MAQRRLSLTDPATAAANRAGELTPEQRRALDGQWHVEAPAGVCSCLFGAVFGAMFFLTGLTLSIALIAASNAPRFLAVVAVPFLIIGAAAMVGAAAALLAGVGKGRRLRDAVAAGRVAQSEGDVVFTRRGYVAQVAGVHLHPPRTTGELNLLPGRYRFSYLPVACILLAAEPLDLGAGERSAPAADPLAGIPGYAPLVPSLFPTPGAVYGASDTPHATIQAALAQALGFGADDLAINREGRLTGRQRLRLLGTAFGFALFAAPFVAGTVLFYWQAERPEAGGFWGWLMFGAFAAGTLLLLAMVVYRLLDALFGSARAIEGAVTGKVVSDSESTSYFYAVHTDRERRFKVGAPAYKALISGLRYRVYYAALSKRVVSAEPLV